MDYGFLNVLWFLLIGVLFTGYFVLEGFDFGVGMLMKVLAKDEKERRVLLNSIGPVWDGNEVWILTGGGAIFAAFPQWYSTLFSGLYLPLFLILLGLIIRGLAIEYRHKGFSQKWRDNWDWAMAIGSFLPALLWGVGLANILRGVPLAVKETSKTLGPSVEYVGGFFNLLNPFALAAGILTLTLFLTHGAIFVALKSTGDIRKRAIGLASKLGLVVALLMLVATLWANLLIRSNIVSWVAGLLSPVAMLAAWWFAKQGAEGKGFIFSAVATGAMMCSWFAGLFPYVMPNIDPGGPALTIMSSFHHAEAGLWGASSSPQTLQLMTIVAVIFVPIVLAYQGWTYWVFHKRLSVKHIPESPTRTPELAAD